MVTLILNDFYMATKLRLARHGAKKRPFYWLMVADARCPRETGKEKLGTYNPFDDKGEKFKVNEERVRYWLACGAQPTDRVALLLSKANILPAQPFRETTKKSLPKKKAQQRLKAAAAAASS
jgi:small subunit ribosomal protein S16